MALLSAADLGLPAAVPCPFCGGLETELHAGFGPQLSLCSYWCRHCRAPFEVFRLSARPLTQDGIEEAGIQKKVAEAAK